ncbi:MAG TPA: hypothetical protein VIS51_03270 [Solirubrobacterales bacterium]
MRSIEKFGLAALAAVVAMSLASATSASATSTQLCKVHTGLTCPGGEAATSVHMTLKAGTVGQLLAAINVLCLGYLVEATALGLGSPQEIHATTQSFTGCGTGSTHNNCTMTVQEQPLSNLLKTGLDEGVLTALNGRTRLVCSNLGLDCIYDFEGIEFEVGGGHLTANETATNELGGKFFCPDEGFLDALLGSLHTPSSTVLCKTHSGETCAEKDQVKSLHIVTAKPPVLYNTIANIECESSLGAATVLAPAEEQKLDVTELTWKGCHTQGAADNCTVTTESLPTLDLARTALNLGTVATLGLEIGIDCTVLGLIELDCVYRGEVSLPVEGALHKEGTGYGMLTASKVELEKLEGEGHCPDSVKWDASYEPLEHVYVLGSALSSGEPFYVLG